MDSYTNKNADLATLNNISSFNGFYTNIYREPLINGFSFIFMTKPLLFIDPNKPTSTKETSKKLAYLNMTRDPYFTQFITNEKMNDMDMKIVKMLSYNTDYRTTNFMPIFTNECKSFDIGDVNMEQFTAFDTKQGYSLPMPTFSTQSTAANTFNISVTEDSNMSFTKIMSIWVNYISNITDGTFDANPEMITEGALDYVSSLYYFMLGPDGKTIKYWAKYTGCWPMNIPYSPLRYAKKTNDLVELDLQFSYTVKEDMNPKILEDFNRISLNIDVGKLDYENNEQYTTIKESPLLNEEKAKSNSIIKSAMDIAMENDDRDPLVLYKAGMNTGAYTDYRADRLELSFGKNGYISPYLKEVFGTEPTEKSMTGYWNEEDE